MSIPFSIIEVSDTESDDDVEMLYQNVSKKPSLKLSPVNNRTLLEKLGLISANANVNVHVTNGDPARAKIAKCRVYRNGTLVKQASVKTDDLFGPTNTAAASLPTTFSFNDVIEISSSDDESEDSPSPTINVPNIINHVFQQISDTYETTEALDQDPKVSSSDDLVNNDDHGAIQSDHPPVETVQQLLLDTVSSDLSRQEAPCLLSTGMPGNESESNSNSGNNVIEEHSENIIDDNKVEVGGSGFVVLEMSDNELESDSNSGNDVIEDYSENVIDDNEVDVGGSSVKDIDQLHSSGFDDSFEDLLEKISSSSVDRKSPGTTVISEETSCSIKEAQAYYNYNDSRPIDDKSEADGEIVVGEVNEVYMKELEVHRSLTGNCNVTSKNKMNLTKSKNSENDNIATEVYSEKSWSPVTSKVNSSMDLPTPTNIASVQKVPSISSLDIRAKKPGTLFISTRQLSQLLPRGIVVDPLFVCPDIAKDAIIEGWEVAYVSLDVALYALEVYGDVFSLSAEMRIKKEVMDLEFRMNSMEEESEDPSFVYGECTVKQFMGKIGLVTIEERNMLEESLSKRREEMGKKRRLRSCLRKKLPASDDGTSAAIKQKEKMPKRKRD